MWVLSIGHSSFGKYPSPPAWGPPWAAVWVSAPPWPPHRLRGNPCSGPWSTSSTHFSSDLGARRAVPHTFAHAFRSLPGSVLPFLIQVSTEAPPASLLGSAVPGAGAAAEPAGTGPVQHGAALDSPQRARPTAPAASTWAWTPKTQGEGAGVQIEITPQGIVLPRCEQWTHFGVCAQVLPSKS